MYVIVYDFKLNCLKCDLPHIHLFIINCKQSVGDVRFITCCCICKQRQMLL